MQKAKDPCTQQRRVYQQQAYLFVVAEKGRVVSLERPAGGASVRPKPEPLHCCRDAVLEQQDHDQRLSNGTVGNLVGH